ncbi:glycoside hydrolase family 30 protein [Paenibacillus taihuensis]|nr:glycoside hydrolase [Paenibacillus taihuensis]
MSENRIEIKLANKKQRMEGFGASGAWWAQHTGSWQPNEVTRLLELLFHPQSGIGLTIYRHNIGGGDGQEIEDPWRRAETYEVSEGEYDWSRDAQAVAVMKQAVASGAERIVAFANSPTPRMTQSGLTSGHQEGRSNFKEGMEDAFATYLVDVVKHLIDVEGLPVDWIAPINEPMWLWNASHNGQEGCHYQPEECVSVYRALARRIEDQGLPVRISALEAGEWSSARMYYYKLAEDKELMKYIDNIAVHSYVPHVSNIVFKEEFANLIQKEQPELPIWMSEWTEMEGGKDFGMSSALVMANLIHEDLTIGQVTSWQYWIAVSRYDFRDGLVYIDEAEGKFQETKRLWVFGQFSKFIRPGYIRVEVESTHPELKVVAYADQGGHVATLVVINNSKEAITSSLEFGYCKHMGVVFTSEEHSFAGRHSGLPLNEWTFAPESVTTIIAETSEV